MLDFNDSKPLKAKFGFLGYFKDKKDFFLNTLACMKT